MKDFDLRPNEQDRAVAIARGLLGTIPWVGPLLAEAISWLAPNQRVDRIANAVQEIRSGATSTGREVLPRVVRRPVRIESTSIDKILDSVDHYVRAVRHSPPYPFYTLPTEMSRSLYRSERYYVLTYRTARLKMDVCLDPPDTGGVEGLILCAVVTGLSEASPRQAEDLRSISFLTMDFFVLQVRKNQLIWERDKPFEMVSTEKMIFRVLRMFDDVHVTHPT